MKNLTAILFTLLLSFSASAEIRELQYMHHAVYDAQPGDVVVFDIDNTILEPKQTLGSDQWFEYYLHKLQKSGISKEKALETTLDYWMMLQYHTDIQAVEPSTPDLIKTLQQKGIMVIALTARNPGMVETSVDQLTHLGVNLHTHNTQYKANDVTFTNGILFVGSNNKGTVLMDYLKTNNLNPKRLLFIDDKHKNVKNVDDAFLDSGIININYRYGAADEKVNSFSAEIAEYQLYRFLQSCVFISDEQAREELLSSFVSN